MANSSFPQRTSKERERVRQVEDDPCTSPRLRLDGNSAAQSLDAVPHHVQPHASTGEAGRLGGGGHRWQHRQAEDLRIAEPLGASFVQ